MITPEYLNEVIKDTEEVVSSVNIKIIKEIAASIYKQWEKKGSITLLPSTIGQFRALMQTGLVSENIEYELRKAYPEIEREIHKAFINSANEMSQQQTDVAKQIIDIEGIDYTFPIIAEKAIVSEVADDLALSKRQIRLLENAYKRTNGTLNNITKTAGNCTEVMYKDMCDELYMKVKQGGISMDQALFDGLKQFSKQGVMVQYGNKAVNLEVAVARSLRTAINQANGEIILQGCREMGVNWVRTSEHLGARVTPNDDYTNHSWWQGKVYSLDWNTAALSDYKASAEIAPKVEYLALIKDATARKKVEEYPDFVKTCGYGDILGICGVNCRHTFQAWYPEINIDEGPQIDPAANKKRYAQEQKARAMESNIRKLKREYEGTKAVRTEEGKAKNKAIKQKLNNYVAEYRDFTQANKIPTANWRIEI